MESYEQFLTTMTDGIFNEACVRGWSWPQLAAHAEVSASTVYKLGMRITRYPQLRTFYRLARAVNMNITLLKKEVHHYAKAS